MRPAPRYRVMTFLPGKRLDDLAIVQAVDARSRRFEAGVVVAKADEILCADDDGRRGPCLMVYKIEGAGARKASTDGLPLRRVARGRDHLHELQHLRVLSSV
jgi:hypothetical protein